MYSSVIGNLYETAFYIKRDERQLKVIKANKAKKHGTMTYDETEMQNKKSMSLKRALNLIIFLTNKTKQIKFKHEHTVTTPPPKKRKFLKNNKI